MSPEPIGEAEEESVKGRECLNLKEGVTIRSVCRVTGNCASRATLHKTRFFLRVKICFVLFLLQKKRGNVLRWLPWMEI